MWLYFLSLLGAHWDSQAFVVTKNLCDQQGNVMHPQPEKFKIAMNQISNYVSLQNIIIDNHYISDTRPTSVIMFLLPLLVDLVSDEKCFTIFSR